MAKHRMELRAWCVDCGTSQPLSSGVPLLEVFADCKVCENRAKATSATDLVLAQCDVCHIAIAISEEHLVGVRCRQWITNNGYNYVPGEMPVQCHGIFKMTAPCANLKHS